MRKHAKEIAERKTKLAEMVARKGKAKTKMTRMVRVRFD